MKVKFTRVKAGGEDADVGTVWVEDGQLRSDPPGFAALFGRVTVHGVRLSPADGDRYLHGLLARHERGSYLRAEEVAEG